MGFDNPEGRSSPPGQTRVDPTFQRHKLFELPINRWSYSIPADQFGAKPYSNPTPTVPPQRVELAEAKVVAGTRNTRFLRLVERPIPKLAA